MYQCRDQNCGNPHIETNRVWHRRVPSLTTGVLFPSRISFSRSPRPTSPALSPPSRHPSLSAGFILDKRHLDRSRRRTGVGRSAKRRRNPPLLSACGRRCGRPRGVGAAIGAGWRPRPNLSPLSNAAPNKHTVRDAHQRYTYCYSRRRPVRH
jgi:hypothetical protein